MFCRSCGCAGTVGKMQLGDDGISKVPRFSPVDTQTSVRSRSAAHNHLPHVNLLCGSQPCSQASTMVTIRPGNPFIYGIGMNKSIGSRELGLHCHATCEEYALERGRSNSSSACAAVCLRASQTVRLDDLNRETSYSGPMDEPPSLEDGTTHASPHYFNLASQYRALSFI